MSDKPILIVIHGLSPLHSQFNIVVDFFSSDFEVHYFKYKMSEKVPGVADRFHEFVAQFKKFSVLTMSFGAIIIRNYAVTHGQEKLERVVMVVPMNNGSELLQKALTFKIARDTLGKIAQDYVAHEERYQLHCPDVELGVIAGTNPEFRSNTVRGIRTPKYLEKAIRKLVHSIFDPSDSDGKVKIHETKLDYMNDYVEIYETHDAMLKNPDMHRQARAFLLKGAFKKD